MKRGNKMPEPILRWPGAKWRLADWIVSMSLYENYTGIPSMAEYGEKQCYWSPKTIKDTDAAIKLYNEYYKLNFKGFLKVLEGNEAKQ